MKAAVHFASVGSIAKMNRPPSRNLLLRELSNSLAAWKRVSTLDKIAAVIQVTLNRDSGCKALGNEKRQVFLVSLSQVTEVTTLFG